MVHETRARAHAAAQEEGKAASKKQKTESKDQERGQHLPSKNKKSAESKGQDGELEAPTKSKKLKAEESELNGKGAAAKEFADFCKAIGEHLSVEDMRKILQANEQDASGSEDAVVPRCEDMMFYGPLNKCPICGYQLGFNGWKYKCTGNYSEWARCTFSTNVPSRKWSYKSSP